MKVFVISEIGINHNGDINLAKHMIDKSIKCGADAVKFQKRDINEVYNNDFLDQPRESPWGKTQREQKEGLEFKEKDYDEIDKYCKSKNFIWFSSAWDLNSLNFLKKYNLKYNKVPSAMIIDIKFLKEVAKQKKYTFISTGMSTYKDISTAVEIFKENNCEFELMHCISAYPFDDHLANLRMITELKKIYKCKVGYSGHEKGGTAISVAAATLGASSLERHTTLDRTMYGSDQAASITYDGFRQLINGIRKIEKVMEGDVKNKKILDIELPVAKKLRAHIKN